MHSQPGAGLTCQGRAPGGKAGAAQGCAAAPRLLPGAPVECPGVLQVGRPAALAVDCKVQRQVGRCALQEHSNACAQRAGSPPPTADLHLAAQLQQTASSRRFGGTQLRLWGNGTGRQQRGTQAGSNGSSPRPPAPHRNPLLLDQPVSSSVGILAHQPQAAQLAAPAPQQKQHPNCSLLGPQAGRCLSTRSAVGSTHLSSSSQQQCFRTRPRRSGCPRTSVANMSGLGNVQGGWHGPRALLRLEIAMRASQAAFLQETSALSITQHLHRVVGNSRLDDQAGTLAEQASLQ